MPTTEYRAKASYIPVIKLFNIPLEICASLGVYPVAKTATATVGYAVCAGVFNSEIAANGQ